MKEGIAIYFGQATSAIAAYWLLSDPFYFKLAAFSVGMAIINAAVLLAQWVIRRAF